MEKIVQYVGGFIETALASADTVWIFAACAGLCLVAFAVQIMIVCASARRIGDLRRVRRFVMKRGDINAENAHIFYKKCVRKMPSSVRKAWKKHVVSGDEYPGSKLQSAVDKTLEYRGRAKNFFVPAAFGCVALLQTLLLCKGLAWSLAVAYTAGAGAIWAVFGITAAAVAAAVSSKNREASSVLAGIIARRLTLRESRPQGVVVVPVKEESKESAQGENCRKSICDSLGGFIDGKPSKDVAKKVCEGLENSGIYACRDAEEAERFGRLMDALKKYTA